MLISEGSSRASTWRKTRSTMRESGGSGPGGMSQEDGPGGCRTVRAGLEEGLGVLGVRYTPH